MALGKTHELINISVLPFFIFLIPENFILPFFSGYIFGTFFMSPDIDIPQSRASRRWRMLRCLWYPYQALFKHRGISHIPVIGTLTRLLYIIFLVTFLYFVIIGILGFIDKNLSLMIASVDIFGIMNEILRSEGAMYFIGGIIVADIVHIITDFISSLLKRIF